MKMMNYVVHMVVALTALGATIPTMGADINAVGQDEKTQLMRAAEGGDTVQVNELITAGANVNATNDIGSTALMLAAQQGHTETVRALLEAGADKGDSEEVARLFEYTETADFIRDFGSGRRTKAARP